MPFPENRNSHLLFRQRVIFMCECVHKCLLYMWRMVYAYVCMCGQIRAAFTLGWAELADCLVSFLYGRQFTFYVAWGDRHSLTHSHTHMGMEKCCVEFCANKNNMLQPLHISEWLRLNRIQYANQNETFLSIDEQTAISLAHTPIVRIVCQASTVQDKTHSHTHIPPCSYSHHIVHHLFSLFLITISISRNIFWKR